MESSFKKGYDKTVNADGSIAISLNGKSRGAAKTANYGMTYIGVFVLCVMLAFTITNSIGFKSLPTYLVVTALIIGGAYFAFYSVFKKFNTKITNLVIKPTEGLIFDGKTLPFSDIQTIGVTHQTSGANLEGNAQVYAYSHGNNIGITGWLPLAVAEAVAKDIKNSSGATWK